MRERARELGGKEIEGEKRYIDGEIQTEGEERYIDGERYRQRERKDI